MANASNMEQFVLQIQYTSSSEEGDEKEEEDEEENSFTSTEN